MKNSKPPSLLDIDFPSLGWQTYLQSPLPDFLETLPRFLSIEGQGSGRQGPSPLAPPEDPAND